MPTRSGKPPQEGTLIQGADGGLYFIPNNNMKAFAVPKKGAAATHANFEEWAAGKKKGALNAVVGQREEPETVNIRCPGPSGRRNPCP